MSAVSSIVSSVAASATPSSSSCATADFTQFPTQDIACAIGSTTTPLLSNTSSILSECCKSAPVEHFNGDCGFYCLSVKQSVAQLQSCFMENGVSPGTIFCNGNNTASATGTPTASASKTSGGGASASKGAAVGVVVPKFSKAGLGVLGVVVVSVFAGVVL